MECVHIVQYVVSKSELKKAVLACPGEQRVSTTEVDVAGSIVWFDGDGKTV